MKLKAIFLFSLTTLLFSSSVSAGILAAKTRLLFEEGQRERSLMLANVNDYPVILQTWVDQGQGNPDHPEIPFITLPPVSKMAAHGLQSLRVVYNGQILPKDRESVYWLNLYEIPAIPQPNQQDAYISLAMNTQLKIFYRPKSLKKFELSDIAKQLDFFLQVEQDHWKLICDNPTAYHASMVNIQLSHQKQVIEANVETDMMSYPKSQRQYQLNGTLPKTEQYQLDFTLIDDFGNQHNFQKNISFIQP